jgi:hypothetical protein
VTTTPWRATTFTLAATLSLGLCPAMASSAPLPAGPLSAGPSAAAPANPAPSNPAPANPAPSKPGARSPLPSSDATVPAPDVLDIDPSRGSTDDATGRAASVFGDAPKTASDHALGRDVTSFDGSNAIGYDFADGYDRTAKAITMECTVRFDAPLGAGDGEETGNFCGAKDAGGYSLTAYGSTLKMMVNLDGTYYGAGTEIEQGVWYHAVGVWDGKAVSLYLNGKKVAETPTKGSAIKVPKDSARKFFLGADTDASGKPQFHGTTSVANAAIYSSALSADQVTARYADVFGKRTEDQAAFTLTSPAPGEQLTRPTTFKGTVENDDLLAKDLTYKLDGKEIALGDEIGPGLKAGTHAISYSGTDSLGAKVSGSTAFTSTSIPTAGGTAQSSGGGSAELTARATSPTGASLRTTFLEGDVSSAKKAQLGTIPASSFDEKDGVAGDVQLKGAKSVDDALQPSDAKTLQTPATDQIPALASDIPFTEAGQSLLWRGEVDPERAVQLLALNTETGRYEVLDSARGSSDGQVELSATADEANDDDGTIRTLVLGTDPFADDLDTPVQDSFEDPDDFDFSLMHITDTQYLSQGATARPTAAERTEWANAYEDSYRWLAEHGQERKVAFVTHTGDVVESWNSGATDRSVPEKEMVFADGAQKKLEDTGIPNAVIPGNHDSLGGTDESLFNETFGPERYEAQEQKDSWKAEGAEYHPWKEGDNSNSFNLFSAGGEDFVTVNLGYSVSEEEADWAAGILAKYPTRNGIVLTHAYNKPSSSPDGRGGPFSADGQIIHDRVLAKSPNAALVLSGHEHGVSISVRRDVGEKGNDVTELLADYQFYEVGSDQLGLTEEGGYGKDTGLRFGASFFRLLQFDLDRGEVSVDTFSPYLDEFGAGEYDTKGRYDGHEDDFTVPVQFNGRTTAFTTDALMGVTPTDDAIGEVTHGSGEDARVTWKGLEDGKPYGWFAVTRDVSRVGDGKQADPEAAAADRKAARKVALKGSSNDLSEGIVQYGVFTGTGTAQDDDGGHPGKGKGDGKGSGKGHGKDKGNGHGHGHGKDKGHGKGSGKDHGRH